MGSGALVNPSPAVGTSGALDLIATLGKLVEAYDKAEWPLYALVDVALEVPGQSGAIFFAVLIFFLILPTSPELVEQVGIDDARDASLDSFG